MQKSGRSSGTMIHLQSFHLAHLPPDLTVHLALYKDLQDAAYLQQQLLQGNPEFEYALIDASTVGLPAEKRLSEAVLDQKLMAKL